MQDCHLEGHAQMFLFDYSQSFDQSKSGKFRPDVFISLCIFLQSARNLFNSFDTTKQGRITLDLNQYFSHFEGVACNQEGLVVNISLQGKGLSGSIPAAISSLKSLTGLYLHFNSLSGILPKEISSLTHLTDLYLNVNSLSGDIPRQIANLSNLQGSFLLEQMFSVHVHDVLSMLHIS
nr:LRR receptor-like serine/threonine-protein kinase GSO2 [Arachis hypogaea]